MKLPFARSYWVEPDRVLAGCYPGAKDPGEAEVKLKGLIECGISCVINLMEAHELDHTGRSFVAYEPRLQELARQGGRMLECHRFAIVDLSVPSVAGMVRILDCLDDALERGRRVYVHCWGGRGRTGTVIACHLRRTRGLTAVVALSLLEELTRHHPAFGSTPEMQCQREFVKAWEERA